MENMEKELEEGEGKDKTQIIDKKIETDKDMESDMESETEMESETDKDMKSEMESEKEEGKKGTKSMNQLSIHLGDILRIYSPENMKYHEKMFLVDYCGVKMMIWIDVETGLSYELKLVGKEYSELEEKEGITSIELLSREKYPGYAKQNGLEVGLWIDVEFGGDIPFLVTGLITNLEEDQIEITTWPNQEVFYLDFQYEGLWNIIPKIEKIQIRDAPSLEAEKIMEELRENNINREVELEELIDGEIEEREELDASLEKEEAETNQLEKLREESVQGTAFAKSIIPEIEIEYGEVLGNMFQRVEQRKEDIRHSLNAQVADFMTELLSTIPNYMRTPQVMEEIEHTLERFRELHQMFARVNNSGAITGYRSNRYQGKPLISSIFDFGEVEKSDGKWVRNTGWIIPVVYMRKKGWHDMIVSEGSMDYDGENNNDEKGYLNMRENMALYDNGKTEEEWIENPACVWLKGIQGAVDKWVLESKGNEGGYRRLLKELDRAMCPVIPFTKDKIMEILSYGNAERGMEGMNIIGPYEAGVPLEIVMDNSIFRKVGVHGNRENDGFYSTVSRGGTGEKLLQDDVILGRRRFVVQKQVDSISLLTMHWKNSGKKIMERETVVENEKFALKSVILLPKHYMAFSRVGLPGTDILTRIHLGSWWPQMSRILNTYTSVDTVEINDLTRDFEYSGSGGRLGKKGRENGREEMEFLDEVREYKLAEENVKTSGSKGNLLEKLMNTVIPNNIYLIDFMYSYLKGSQYSLTHYAKLMEPFGIYSWNMRYAESHVMQKKIREKMGEYRISMENGRKEYGGLAQYYKKNEWGVKYRNTERFFHWLRSRGEEFTISFLDWYHLNIGGITTSEILVRIYNLDEGNLLSSIMNYLHYALITLNRFTGNRGVIGGGGNGNDWLGGWGEEGARLGIHGGKLHLAKRYDSLSDLNEENHRTDLYWDKSLDHSPYHLADQYGGETGGVVGNNSMGTEVAGIAGVVGVNLLGGVGDEGYMEGRAEGAGGAGGVMDDLMEGGGGEIRQTMRQKLSASEFLEYLAMNLKERHYCPAEQAVELASILIHGKRPIKGGEYASVQLGGGDVAYYERIHHTWVRNTSLDFGKEMNEKSVFSNLENMKGALGVLYGGGAGGNGGGKKASFNDREIVSLSGNVQELQRTAKWNHKKEGNGRENGRGGDGENGGAREKELAKEMFQQKIQQSLKELEASFESKMTEQIARIVRIYSLKQMDLKRANTFAYYLGKYKKETEMRVSPHAKLLELILEEPDFDLKQRYLVRFYHSFCREPILGGGMEGEEKAYWKYCSETNVPLLPTSYYDLALEYMNGGDYGQLLELLCSRIGDKSSDGEATIDRYTGRVLRKLDLDIEEGYNEMGFKHKTREALNEEDMGEELGESAASEGNRIRKEERQIPDSEEMEGGMEEEGYLVDIEDALAKGKSGVVVANTKRGMKTAKEYGEGENEMIANVAFYFLQEMGIIVSDESEGGGWIEEWMNFVILLVSELLSNKSFIDTEERFEKKRKAALKKGESFPFESYELYKNQRLLYWTIGAILIGLQTVTNEMKLSKNATSCIRSLKGYPTGMGGSGKDDKSALRYIVCLLLQQQSDEAPWNSRNKSRKEDTQMNAVVKYVDEYILPNRAVEDRIGARRAYEAEHGGDRMEETIPLGLRIERLNLLPPMEKGLRIEERQIMSVSRDFLEEWKTEMTKSLKMGSGNKEGGSEGVVRMKLMALGYSLFENVNTEVARQIRGFLMKTMLGEAYLENACCQNEGIGAGQIPLRYFIEKNALIGKVLKTSRLLERALEIGESPKKTVLLYHSESTRIGNGEFWDRGNGSSYFKANIYAALIHYFHYDRPLLPVPEYLRGKIYEEVPKGYPIGGLLKEKIEFLEKAGRNYDVEKLQYCLKLVGQQNILSGAGEIVGATEDSDDNNYTKVGEALGDFLTNSVFENGVGVGDGRRGEGYEEFIQKLTDVFREWKRGTMMNQSSRKIRALNDFLAKSNIAMFKRISTEWKPSGGKETELLLFLEKIQSWNIATDIDRESINRANSDSLQQIVRFIRNMCNMFAFTYKKRIENMQDFNRMGKKALPKHWGFADEHYTLLANYISKTFGGLIRKRDDTDNELFAFFEKLAVEEDGLFRQIRQLLDFFPVFTPLSLVVGENGERETFYSLFPKETCYGVHVYCLYFILTRYLEVSQMTRMIGKKVRKSKYRVGDEGDLFVSMSDALEGEEEEGDFSRVYQENREDEQIIDGRRMSWKEKIRQFFYDCLEVELDNKEAVDYTYDQLRQKQNETEKREKTRITERLRKMEIYQRRVENQMKDLKLGNWNVGQQKGLFQYDKETFHREISEQMTGEEDDLAGGRRGVLYDTTDDLGEEYLNGEEADRLREMESNGEIMGLGEDWDDGGDYF